MKRCSVSGQTMHWAGSRFRPPAQLDSCICYEILQRSSGPTFTDDAAILRVAKDPDPAVHLRWKPANLPEAVLS